MAMKPTTIMIISMMMMMKIMNIHIKIIVYIVFTMDIKGKKSHISRNIQTTNIHQKNVWYRNRAGGVLILPSAALRHLQS